MAIIPLKQPLKDRLGTLPWVIAGPILRRVTPKSVTVWLALQKNALVTLNIKDDKGKQVATGNRSTVAIGVNLHVAAVTARPVTDDLKEGIVYQYDLDFPGAADPGRSTNLAQLAYGPAFTLPSFALPPAALKDVRLFHGSCRMPHGSGPDALALLDVLIEQAASNGTFRPHQLLLTGDQIYADDVSAALLPLLTDAGNTLLYGSNADSGAGLEVLPVINKPTNALPPYWRFPALQAAGFTSDDMRSHLMSLSEYLAMYLFTWSDVLWPTAGNSTALPTGDVVKALKDSIAGSGANSPQDDGAVVEQQWVHHPQKEIEDDAKDVTNLYGTLFRIRRALANIPTYMICDDHEVTDDWNMTLGFCQSVYKSNLGRRVIQNALVAYALCQHWGNVPDVFDTSGQPGFTLLGLLDGKNAKDYENNSPAIQKIVGVRDQPEQRNSDPGSLIYNYTIETYAYQVIVTDTRTWRTFPDGNNTTGHFLPTQPTDQLKAQISSTPSLSGRALLVVLTTNAPPTEPIRTAARNPWKTKTFGGSESPDIYDAWDLPSVALDRLLVALTNKLPLDQGTLKGSVILLSGDVHHSFASHLKYRATRRFEDTHPQPASVVFAQLVSSSFKKQNGQTIMLHKEGYTGAPWIAKSLIPPHKEEGYIGFNLPAGTVIGQQLTQGTDPEGIGKVDFWRTLKLKDQPTILMGGDVDEQRGFLDPSKIKLASHVVPDYRYRLDYLNVDVQGQQAVTPPSIPAFLPGVAREVAVAQFNMATNFYRDYNYQGWSKQQIVGLNNIAEVTFDILNGKLDKVNHTVRWKLEDKPDFVWGTYRVIVTPDDDVVYPDMKAANE